jgi:hypothetical protein
MFDTLTYANKLKEAGFTERQAQAQAEALVAVVDSNLATKHDLKELELKFEGKFLIIEGKLLLVNWMLGFILAGTLSIILKTFFSH